MGLLSSKLERFCLIALGLLCLTCRVEQTNHPRLPTNYKILRLRGGRLPKQRIGEFASWGMAGNREKAEHMEEDIGEGRPLREGKEDPEMDKWMKDDPYNKPTDEQSYQVTERDHHFQSTIFFDWK